MPAGRTPADWDDRIDAVVLHPVWGLVLLAVTLFLMFQAVFSWAVPMDWIEGRHVAGGRNGQRPHGRRTIAQPAYRWNPWGPAGGGFLPQILILFFFILALEDSGYLPRAPFCWTA